MTECIEYLKNNSCIKDIDIKENSNKILEYIYNVIKETNKTYNIDIQEQNTPLDKSNNFAFLHNNPFVPSEVFKFIEDNELHRINYKINSINLNVYSTPNKNVDIQKIIHIVTFMTRLANPNIIKEININVLNCGFYKDITNIDPKNGLELGPVNINSGSSIRGRQISFWRVEEIDKVLIHELMHFFGLDIMDEAKNGALDNYSKNFRVMGSKILLNESYTEAVAIIIHTLYILSKLDETYTSDGFKKLFLWEVNFSLFQAAKILNHYNITTLSQLDITQSKDEIYVVQSTSVFSYYLIKVALLLKFNNLIKFFINTELIKFNNDKIVEFVQLIDQAYKSNTLQKCIKFYRKQINNNSNNDFISKTLRMSCLEAN